MSFLEMVLQLAHQLLLDMEHSPADLTDRVVVVARRELVIGRAFAEVRGVDRAGCSERFQRAVDGTARKTWLVLVELSGDLFRGAVTSQGNDRVVHLRSLSGPSHPGGEHQRAETTRRERSAFVRTRQPDRSTTT